MGLLLPLGRKALKKKDATIAGDGGAAPVQRGGVVDTKDENSPDSDDHWLTGAGGVSTAR
jgi:hypothetical protein